MQRHVARFAVVRYGVAVVCVTATVLVALWLRPIVLAAAQLLLVAVLITGWVSGLRPALVAWVLAMLAFGYYFTPPFDSLKIEIAEVPRLVIFTLLAAFLATMSAARRNAEDSLKRAREQLEARVRERTAELERSNEGLQAAVADAVAAQHRFGDLVNSVEGIVWEGDRPAQLRGVMVDITERKRTEQNRRWFVESMDRVNRAIQGTNDLEQMMSDVLDAALSIFDCDRAWLVYPCDPEAHSHGVKMQRTRPEYPGLFGVGDEVPMDPETAGVLRTVRASSGPVRFGPGSQHPLPAEMAKRLGIQSRIVMALYPKGDQPYMFGLSQCSYPRIWTPQEERLFQDIGRRLTDALTSLSIFCSLRESEKRYRYIFDSTGVAIAEEDYFLVKAAIEDLKSSGVREFREYFAAHPEFVRQAIKMVRIVDPNNAAVK